MTTNLICVATNLKGATTNLKGSAAFFPPQSLLLYTLVSWSADEVNLGPDAFAIVQLTNECCPVMLAWTSSNGTHFNLPPPFNEASSCKQKDFSALHNLLNPPVPTIIILTKPFGSSNLSLSKIWISRKLKWNWISCAKLDINLSQLIIRGSGGWLKTGTTDKQVWLRSFVKKLWRWYQQGHVADIKRSTSNHHLISILPKKEHFKQSSCQQGHRALSFSANNVNFIAPHKSMFF